MMNNILKYLFLFALVSFASNAQSQPTNKIPFANKWEFKGIAIDEPGYHVCGSSPIMGSDGRVHLFSARWKIAASFDPGWRSHSEIAHYVADSPEGPFRFVDVVLQGSGKDTWDT